MNTAGPIFILGSGTFAEEVATVLSDIPDVRIAGLVESLDRTRCGANDAGRPIVWVEELKALAQTHRAIAGLGTTHRKAVIEQVAGYGMPFETFAHPTANLATHLMLGEGTYIGAAVTIASHTTVHDHVSINRGALIGHHTEIGSYTTIGPGANIAGSCSLGTACYVGMGAIILDHIRIGERAVIGAGAVVTKDVPDRVQVVGVPARIVKENVEGK